MPQTQSGSVCTQLMPRPLVRGSSCISRRRPKACPIWSPETFLGRLAWPQTLPQAIQFYEEATLPAGRLWKQLCATLRAWNPTVRLLPDAYDHAAPHSTISLYVRRSQLAAGLLGIGATCRACLSMPWLYHARQTSLN